MCTNKSFIIITTTIFDFMVTSNTHVKKKDTVYANCQLSVHMPYACVDMLCNRGYENVDWDSKLPPRHKPPTTTLEKMSDPMSQRLVLKRYHSRPEPWQVSLLHWK